jgi:hypothetical protein
MLDFLLVLGQVPGTNFQITFNEIVATFCVLYLLHVYLKYSLEIHRWRRMCLYRMGVYYRLQKRRLRTYIKLKRYRLAVFERRIIRRMKTYARQRRQAFLMFFYRRYSSMKRRYYIKLVQIDRLMRRIKRSKTFQNYLSIKDFVSQSV